MAGICDSLLYGVGLAGRKTAPRHGLPRADGAGSREYAGRSFDAQAEPVTGDRRAVRREGKQRPRTGRRCDDTRWREVHKGTVAAGSEAAYILRVSIFSARDLSRFPSRRRFMVPTLPEAGMALNAVIDLSHYQNVTSWSEVAADGIAAIINKCTQGTGFVDPT
ncbi:MAG TPA: hypothetical protein VFQ39_02600, partial [Longimicrobium sp.]|nr:hypothetical protein [Longimicrobium sp.]